MSKAATAIDDVRDLLARHGRYIRQGEQGAELWIVGNKTVSVPGKNRGDGAWMSTRRDIRRALHAAGVAVQEDKEAEMAKNGAYQPSSAEPLIRVTSPRDLPVAEEARAFADAALALGERAARASPAAWTS